MFRITVLPSTLGDFNKGGNLTKTFQPNTSQATAQIDFNQVNVTTTTNVAQGQLELESRLDGLVKSGENHYVLDYERMLIRDELRQKGCADPEMVEWAGLIASNLDFDVETRLQGLLFIETLVTNHRPRDPYYQYLRGMFHEPNPNAIMPAIQTLTDIASMQVSDDKIRKKAIQLLGSEILYPCTARAIGIALYKVINLMQDSPDARFWLANTAQSIGGAEGYYILEKMNTDGYLDIDDEKDRKTIPLVKRGIDNLAKNMFNYYVWPAQPDGSTTVPDITLEDFLSDDPGRFLSRSGFNIGLARAVRAMHEIA